MWSLEEELDIRVTVLQQLQEVLPECQQKEREQLEFRKSIVEEQMGRAQRSVSEMARLDVYASYQSFLSTDKFLFVFQCDKIKKRRSSLFGTFHLANSSVLEEAGLQITKAV